VEGILDRLGKLAVRWRRRYLIQNPVHLWQRIASVVWEKVDDENDRKVPGTAKHALFRRRAELGNIHLNCENTNTPALYVDLSLGIPRKHIHPFPDFKSFLLPLISISALDAQYMSAIKPHFQPEPPGSNPRSDFAVIDIFEPSLS
jgi:hypothetical protein